MICYKYISSEISLLILKDSAIRFTQPKALNDAFEMTPTFTEQVKESVVKKLFDELVTSGYFAIEFNRIINEGYENLEDNSKRMFSKKDFEFLTQSMLKRKLENENLTMDGYLFKYFVNNNSVFKDILLKNWIELLNENIGVLSLSAVQNNILMWSHYCNSNQGVVLEFNTDNDFFKPLLKIEYSENPPELNLANWEEIEKNPSLGMPILTTKSLDWEYEQEYRVYKNFSHSDYYIGNDSLGLPIYLYKFPTESITKIIFGLNTPKKVIDEIVELCPSEKYPNLSFSKVSSKMQSKYEFEITKFNL